MRTLAVGFVSVLTVLLVSGLPAVGAQPSPLNVVLALDRTAYEPGTPIGYTVRVSNISNQPVTVTFNSAQRFDLSLQSDAVLAARQSDGQSFQMATTRQTWAPGEIVTYSGSWLPLSALLPGLTNAPNSQPIPGGIFRMVAQLTAVEMRPVSAPEVVVIGMPSSLGAGCTTLAAPFSQELPVSIVARAIDPPTALQSLWQRSVLLGEFTAYQVSPQIGNDLSTINRRNPLTICLTAPARLITP